MKKILIADDDKQLLNAYRMAFKNKNYQTFFAKDGEEAVKIIDEERPELVLLDLIMPNLNGFGVIKELQKRELYPYIIVMTNINGANMNRVEGVHEVFVKSDVKIMDVVKKVEKILE